MVAFPWQSSRRVQRRSVRSRQFQLEGLESRLVLYSTTGGMWTYNTITYSFVPDGTFVAASNNGNIYSNLNQSLAAEGISTAQWQQVMDKAAATWEEVAGINLVRIGDDGGAIGSSNYQQGNPNEGDIRIAGYAQDPSTLAYTILPPPINGGSASGDIFFNTSMSWNGLGSYDLLTVALHEFGHALGMGHSQIQQAVMYAMYTGQKQQLNSDDVAGIDSIWGLRQPDAFNANGLSNATEQTAANINADFNQQNQITLPSLTLNTVGASEWFQVTVPATSNGHVTITEQSTGLSSMSPSLWIFTPSGSLLGRARALYSYGATVSVSLNLTPGETFLIRATDATSTVDGVGAFGLEVNAGTGSMNPIPTPNTVVYAQPGSGGGMSETDAYTVSPGFVPPGTTQLPPGTVFGDPALPAGGPGGTAWWTGFLTGQNQANQNMLSLWDQALDSLSS